MITKGIGYYSTLLNKETICDKKPSYVICKLHGKPLKKVMEICFMSY